MPNYWSRFTHFHSIRSPARADLSPTSPPLRPRRPRCRSLAAASTAPTSRLPDLSPTARFYLISLLKFRFHFLVSAEPPTSHRPRRPLAADQSHTKKRISIFRYMTPRRPALISRRPRRRSDRADLAAAPSRSPSHRTRSSHRNLHFHFFPPPPADLSAAADSTAPTSRCRSLADLAAASTAPTSLPPHLRAFFISAAPWNFVSIFWYPPSRRPLTDRADLSPDDQSHAKKRISIFCHTLCLPTLPPPLRGIFLPTAPTPKQRVCKKQSYPIVAHYTTSLLICQLLLRILLFFPANSNKTCQTVPFFRIFFIFL